MRINERTERITKLLRKFKKKIAFIIASVTSLLALMYACRRFVYKPFYHVEYFSCYKF